MTKKNGFAVVLFALVGTAGTYDWTDGAYWTNNAPFVSDSANELRFFVDTSLNVPTGTKTITNVPSALSMNTLTLNGGCGNNAGQYIIFGDSSSVWTIGDGTTSTINLNANNWSFETQSVFFNLPHIRLNHTNTTITGSGDNNGNIFAGNITETAPGAGFTKSGTSEMIISGTNTYTGTTAVNGGLVRLNSANALPGGTGSTGGISALSLGGGVVELANGDFLRNLGAGSNQFQITGGTSGFSARGGLRNLIINNDTSQEIQWNSTYFKPTTLVLNAGTANNTLWFANKLDLNTATRTVEVNANVAVVAGDIRTSSGTAGLTKTGGGTLVLSGSNTYNGTTTISAGTLSVSAAGNLGSSGLSGLILNTGTLQISGTALTSISAATINSGNKGFNIVDASNTFTVNQVLNQGTGTLTKDGPGTLVLSQDNTFTGATTLTGGGTLVLDYTTNNGSKLSNTAALNLNGGALVLKGSNHVEVVSSTSIAQYTSSAISRDGGSAKISLGALTLNGPSCLSIAESNLATTTSANAAPGILTLGRVSVGSDFGANDGSNNITNYTGYTTYTPATATVGSATVVNQLTGAGTLANSLVSYSLRIANSDNSDVLEMGSKTLTLSNNGTFLYAGGFDNQYTINGSASAYLSSGSGNQYFGINIYAGATLTLNVRTSSNYAPVLKAGQGTLVLGGDNSTLGIMYVREGVLRVTNSAGLGNTSNGTVVGGGAALELANNITIGAETLTLAGAGISSGGALRNVSGINSFGGAITLGGGGASIIAAGGSLALTGGITTAGAQILTFGGAGDISVGGAPAISGAANLVKDGVGTLGLVVSDSSNGSVCGDMALKAGKLAITFNVAPNTSVPVLKVLGDLTFTGTPTLEITVDPSDISTGVEYPLLTVSGSAPSTVPTLEGFTGSLKWGGPGNRTLILNTGATGMVFILK